MTRNYCEMSSTAKKILNNLRISSQLATRILCMMTKGQWEHFGFCFKSGMRNFRLFMSALWEKKNQPSIFPHTKRSCSLNWCTHAMYLPSAEDTVSWFLKSSGKSKPQSFQKAEMPSFFNSLPRNVDPSLTLVTL